MPSDVDDSMAAEFGTVAQWTAEVVSWLGPDYAVPGACRGSGQPTALDWLLAGLDPAPGGLLIDVGAGLGGPAAYATAKARVRPLLLEPERGACRAAAGLFGAPVIQADATALPLGDGRADAAWSLGVLCTLPSRDAQLAMLRELRRIVRPGGRIGLLVYVAARLPLDDPPEGNRFPTGGELDSLVRAAGLQVLGAADARRMSAPPADWRDRTEAVERELHRRFGRTPQLRTSDEQRERIGNLLESGQLTCRVLVLRGPEDRPCPAPRG
jgi:SAM-dependent methyltransferase